MGTQSISEEGWGRSDFQLPSNGHSYRGISESAALPWYLHDDQSISFIIPSTLAGKAGPKAGRAQWEPG